MRAGIWWAARNAAEQTADDSQTALDAHVDELLKVLERKAAIFPETIKDWLDRGTVSAHELWELLQELEKAKQSAHLLALMRRPR